MCYINLASAMSREHVTKTDISRILNIHLNTVTAKINCDEVSNWIHFFRSANHMLSHLYCGRELRSSSISSQIRQTLSTVDSTMLTILLICRAERMPIKANNITETLKMMQVLLRCLICFSRFSIE